MERVTRLELATFSLGIKNFRSFIFNTYNIAQKKVRACAAYVACIA